VDHPIRYMPYSVVFFSTCVEFEGLSCADQVLTKLSAEGDAAGGTDPGCVHGRAMTDGLAVIGDCDIRLKYGLVTTNGSILGLVGRISADPNSLRNMTSESVESTCIIA